MPAITTDDVYSFFVKQDRALTAREIAAHFSVGRDHVNRLLRKMIEREERVRSVRINGIKSSDAPQAVNQMLHALKHQYKPATLNRTIGTIKKALALAFDRGIVPANYGATIKRLKENNEREVYLSIAQVEHLASCASENVKAAIWIAIYTGMRRGEIIKLNEAEIGKDTITILSGNTKTLKRRTVPIIEPLRPWLKHLPLPINAEGLKSGFRRAREKAGLPHVHFHDLRRTSATLMVQAGVDLYVVSKLLGHSSVTVTQKVYAHLQVDQVRDGLNKAFC